MSHLDSHKVAWQNRAGSVNDRFLPLFTKRKEDVIVTVVRLQQGNLTGKPHKFDAYVMPVVCRAAITCKLIVAEMIVNMQDSLPEGKFLRASIVVE